MTESQRQQMTIICVTMSLKAASLLVVWHLTSTSRRFVKDFKSFQVEQTAETH